VRYSAGELTVGTEHAAKYLKLLISDEIVPSLPSSARCRCWRLWWLRRAGIDRVRIPVGAKYLSLLQNVQPGSGAHPASYFMGTGIVSRGQTCRGARFITQLHLAQRLRTIRAIHLIRLVSLVNGRQAYGLTV